MKITILFFTALACATIVTHTYVEEFEPCAHELLSRDWAESVSGAGNAVRTDLGLRLVSKDKASVVSFWQEIKEFKPGSKVLVSANMRCSNLVPGEKSWHLARLVLIQNDGVKERYDLPHGVGSISGTQPLAEYRKAITIDPDTRRLKVSAQLNRCMGIFELENIRMIRVVKSMTYNWASRAVLLGWSIFGLYLVGWIIFVSTYRGVILKGVVIASFAAIILGTAMPWEMKKEVVREVSGQLQETSHLFGKEMSGLLPKIGHFVFFTIFAIALYLMTGQTLWQHALVSILLIAGASELAQFFIEGRSPLMMDFFIDAGGGMLGLSFVWLFNLILTPDTA